jgi:hypothetical protein
VTDHIATLKAMIGGWDCTATEHEALEAGISALSAREGGEAGEVDALGFIRWSAGVKVPNGTKLFLHPAQPASQQGEISEARVEAALAVLGLRADRKDDVRAALRVAGAAHPAADKVLVTDAMVSDAVSELMGLTGEHKADMDDARMDYLCRIARRIFALSPPANGENDGR